jgi:hypothetical protein
VVAASAAATLGAAHRISAHRTLALPITAAGTDTIRLIFPPTRRIGAAVTITQRAIAYTRIRLELIRIAI